MFSGGVEREYWHEMGYSYFEIGKRFYLFREK